MSKWWRTFSLCNNYLMIENKSIFLLFYMRKYIQTLKWSKCMLNKLYYTISCFEFFIFFIISNFYSKLPKLLVIHLTAAFFNCNNFNLYIYYYLFLWISVFDQFNHLIFDLKALFANKHFHYTLLIDLCLNHMTNFFSYFFQKFKKTLRWLQTILKYCLRKSWNQL